jgi:hypothetical protein
MKTVSTIFSLFLTISLFGQGIDFESPDSLATVKLDFDILDSNAIKATNPLINIHFRNIVSYYSKDGIKLAYCTTDKNKWTAFLLPFSERTNDFSTYNLDKKGQVEIIVRGQILNYGSGGGTGDEWVMIYNIDSVPTQIFKVHYGCFEESFGDKNNNGKAAYTKGYTRQIKITDTTITISTLDKKKYPRDTDCTLTNIPNGEYIMESGQIKKKK